MSVAACGRGRAGGWALAALLLAAPVLDGCSLRKLAVRTVANALASGNDVYATDDDPELVGAALPFALKTLEGLLQQDPANRNLLLASGRGFTQYAYAFVQLPAEELGAADFERAEGQRHRALGLFLRGRGYALRGLEVTHPGIGGRLQRDPAAAANELTKDDLALAYWTAAAWGAAIGLGKDHPELLADLPAVRALLERALALDETWEHGTIHQAFMTLEAATPGPDSMAKAKGHFTRAVALSGGHDASPYVIYAESISVPGQDRVEFESMLKKALAIDTGAAPELRLANTLAQRRASRLLAHVDDYFLSDEPAADEAKPPANGGDH